MESLHTLAPFSHLRLHITLSSTPYSCLNVGTSIPESEFRIRFNQCPALIIEDQPEFEISDILDARLTLMSLKLQYLVQWTGYEGTDEETLGSMPMSLKCYRTCLRIHLATHPSGLSQSLNSKLLITMKFLHVITSSTKSYYSSE